KGNIILTNTHASATTTINGTKTWDDNNNQDGKRPNQVTINLLANGKVVDTKTVTSQDNWAYNFTEKPKYQDGKEILYTITEDTVPDYNTIIDGFNVTNSYTPGQTSVTVTKNWVDDNNNDQIRPDQIKVQLLADGKVQGDPVVLNQASQWQYTWNHLPEKANGQDIVYSVEEVKVDGYTSTVNDKDKGNIILTNTHASATTTINGTKTWDDNNNQAGNRPNSITVNLLADGKKVTDQVVKADQNGKWLYAFKDMPKFSNGKAIVYSVTEEAVKNYKSSVTGFNITNKYITLSTTPTNGNSPTNGSSPTTDGLPSTGEASQSALILLGGLMLALLVSYIYYKKRQV
ncbi:Cna B-type domain-containing protein, partial [Lactococcus lactis]